MQYLVIIMAFSVSHDLLIALHITLRKVFLDLVFVLLLVFYILLLWVLLYMNNITGGRFDAFHPKGRTFESHSSRQLGTLGKFFTRSCLWRFGVKFRQSIRAASGALLSSGGLEEAL